MMGLAIKGDTPPDLRPGLFGLADLAAPGHVVAGTRIHWEATSMACGAFPSAGTIYQCLVGNLGPALQDVTVNVNNPIIGGISVQIDGTVGFERNSISDIESDLIASVQLCGCSVTASTPVTIVQNWTGTSPGQPGASPQAPPGACDQESGLNWIACQMGMGGAASSSGLKLGLGTAGVVALAVGAIVVFAILKR